MSDTSPPQPSDHYSRLAKLFHWGFVGLFAYGVAKQIDDLDQLADSDLLRFEVVFAGVFVLLLGVRFAYMKRTQTSALPATTPPVQKLAARIVHGAMYVSLAGIALSGLLIGLVFWLGFEDGWLIQGVVGLHELFVLASYWFIGIHIVAACYHRFLRDGVWHAMVPFWQDGHTSHKDH